jgi:hypothetical protein
MEHLHRFASTMPIPANGASGLIHDIREQHGFNDDNSTPSPVVLGLRGKLERALER